MEATKANRAIGIALSGILWSAAHSAVGSELNNGGNPLVQPGGCEVQSDGTLACANPELAGGGRDQSLQFADRLLAGKEKVNDLQIGGLGADLMMAGPGADIQIGGLEHFFPQNRDQAFGEGGSDIFIWKPGDGSDFYHGGPGRDAVVFGNIGEPDGAGGVDFGVKFDRQRGEVFIDSETNLPLVDVTNSPGFCTVIDETSSPEAADELAALGLDHLVRFTIRGLANSFEAGQQSDDNGLRVTLHLQDVEFLVCTGRDGGDIEVLDLGFTPPLPMSLDQLPNSLRRRLEQIIR